MSVNAERIISEEERLLALQDTLQLHLEQVMPAGAQDDAIMAAMRAATLVPGKRIRPTLLMLTVQDLGGNPWHADVLHFAAAIEMVHAASLILDDLPCMDNATTRRGQPALHCQFGESVTILAAIALLSRAFELLATTALPAEAKAEAVSELSRAVGQQGLVQGQFRDLTGAPRAVDSSAVTTTNDLKTGVLFEATFQLAAIASGASAQSRQQLREASAHMGQAFQLLDDLNDERQDTGKDACQDRGKSTLVNLLGVSKVRQRLQRHIQRIGSHLDAACQGPNAAGRFLHLWFHKQLARTFSS
ncbi:geranylgeranyl pyrophosphate synthase [Enterobacterales bacterium CwR94]|nr:geranylgeranyl pyrophosphate synthase [Enterobacterales bacterium CwR94]